MVQIQNQNLIVTIPCSNSNPLEILGEIQEALYASIELIDYENGPKKMISHTNQQISLLLKALAISPIQLGAINDQALMNEELKKHFIK